MHAAVHHLFIELLFTFLDTHFHLYLMTHNSVLLLVRMTRTLELHV
jgi:hypothetical protein